MQRNGIIFQQQPLDKQALCHTIKWRVELWSLAWVDPISYSAEMLALNFHSIPVLFH